MCGAGWTQVTGSEIRPLRPTRAPRAGKNSHGLRGPDPFVTHFPATVIGRIGDADEPITDLKLQSEEGSTIKQVTSGESTAGQEALQSQITNRKSPMTGWP